MPALTDHPRRRAFEAYLPPAGRLQYFPCFFDAHVARDYFRRLLEELPLKQGKIKIFGNDVKEPRLSAWMGEASYLYSGKIQKTNAWTPTLAQLKARVEHFTHSRFNGCLANFYRNGLDSMGLHSDDEAELGENPIIVSLSFGSVRRFVLKAKVIAKKIAIDLEPGSLLVMSGDVQHHWKHGLPKTKRVTSSRLNLTFRKIV